MRRTVAILAAAGAVIGTSLTALPAIASVQSRSGSTIGSSTKPALTVAQMRELATARHIEALLHGRGTGAGSIRGTVQGVNGHPLSQVCVTAAGPGGSRTVLSGSDGRYVIASLSVGQYRVTYQDCTAFDHYLGKIYHSPSNRAGAHVTAYRAAQLAPVRLAQPGLPAVVQAWHAMVRAAQRANLRAAARGGVGRIGGQVTTKAGRPLKGICVGAYPAGYAGPSGGFLPGPIVTVTSKTGGYAFQTLPPGKYQLQFGAQTMLGCRNTPDYAPQVWKHTEKILRASTLTVRAGRTISHIDAALSPGAVAVGSIRSQSGRPLGGVCVLADETLQNINDLLKGSVTVVVFAEQFDLVTGTTSRANGGYRLQGMSTGKFRLGAYPAPQCGDNTGNYIPVVLPKAVPVRDGKTIVHNFRLPTGGVISGIVSGNVNGSVKPVSGICVAAQGPGGFTSTVTDNAGRYRIQALPSGTYSLQFGPGCGNSGNYLTDYVTAKVQQGKVTGLNVDMPTGGILSGTVTDAHGKPVGGVCVQTYNAGGSIDTYVVTGPTGTYAFQQLPTDKYVVQFYGGCGNVESVAPQFYKNDPTGYEAIAVPVTQGQTTGGINAAMQPGGTVTGRVTNQAGQALPGTCVSISNSAYGGYGLQADQAGNYSVSNLLPGQYRVSFVDCQSPQYAGQEFQGQPIGGTGDLLYVPGGVVTAGVNGVLTPAGSISGVVRNRAGRPLTGVCVLATNTRTGAIGETITDSGGKYALTSVSAGQYRVYFSASSELLANVTGPFCQGGDYAGRGYSTGGGGLTSVTVRAHRTTAGINTILDTGGSITGTVHGLNGRPVPNTCVVAYNAAANTLSTVSTDGRGDYRLIGLGTGAYAIMFNECGNIALDTVLRPGLVHVQAGRTIAGINAALQLGGTVSGVVTVASSPAPGTCVEAVPMGSGVSGSVFSDAHGLYSMTNLAPGRYRVYFALPGCSALLQVAPQTYAGIVTVINGGKISGVNAALTSDGGITGTVRGPSNTGLTGICVRAVPAAASDNIGPVVAITASGGYDIGYLPPGTYKVEFSSGCGLTGYATRWYPNAGTEPGGTVVPVSAGTTSTGIDGTLPRG